MGRTATGNRLVRRIACTNLPGREQILPAAGQHSCQEPLLPGMVVGYILHPTIATRRPTARDSLPDSLDLHMKPLLALPVSFLLLASPVRSAEPVDYVRDIKPIL